MKKMRLIAAMSLVGLGLSGLSGCAELPGGETNDTTNDTTKASISISVNGTAVEANGSVTVDELTPFTLKATVNNGEADDVVSWGSSTASAFTFSSSTGLETTATANYASSTPIQLFAQLQDDASVKTTVNVTINPAEREYQLSLNVPEDLKTFTQGDAFTANGLEVMVQETINGSVADSYLISEEEYTVSIVEGTILSHAGRQTVTVTATDETFGSATYDITVLENELFPIADAINKLNSVGYTYGSVNSSGMISFSEYVTSDRYFDSMTGIYYRLENDGKVKRYEQLSTPADSYTLRDLGNAYLNGKPATNLNEVIKYKNGVVTSFSDLPSNLIDGMTTYSDQYGEYFVFSESASLALADALGYSNLAIMVDNQQVELPVDHVEAMLDHYDDESAMITFMTYIEYPTEEDPSVKEPMLAGIDVFATLNCPILAENGMTPLEDFAEFDDAIDTKKAGVYIAYDESYVDTNLDMVFNTIAEAPEFAYEVNGMSASLYNLNANSAEALVVNSDGYYYSGIGLLDGEYSAQLGDELVDYEPGLVTYLLVPQPDQTASVSFSESDTSITSMGQLSIRWGDAPLFTEDARKMYTLDSFGMQPVYGEDNETLTGLVESYTYGLSGDELDFTSSLDYIDWANSSETGENQDHLTTEFGFTPLKVEVNLTLSYTASLDGSGNLTGLEVVGYSVGINYYIQQDGLVYGFYQISEAEYKGTKWDTLVSTFFTAKGTETPNTGEETDPVEPQA